MRHRTRILLAGAAALLMILAILPAALNLEIHARPVDAPGHHEGAYVDLPSGRTHYVQQGTGPTVILVAGLTGNFTVWDRALPYLAQKFNVIAYDTFGRGFSERRETYPYTRDMYRQQLSELVATLPVTRVAIVGTSMGGAIALDFAAAQPEALWGLVVVDTAGLPFETPAVRNLVDVPGLGEYLISVLMPVILHQGFERGFADPAIADERFRYRYELSAGIVGFKRAVLESLRRMPLHSLGPTIDTVADSGIPTLIAWGDQDKIVPFEVYGQLRKRMPQAEGIVFRDAGHMPHAERPNLFGSNVAAFLARQAPAPVSVVANAVDN